MWNAYVNGSPERLESRLGSLSLYDIVLDLIASRAVRNVDELIPLLRRSYYAANGGTFSESVVAGVVDRLERLKLTFTSSDSPAAGEERPSHSPAESQVHVLARRDQLVSQRRQEGVPDGAGDRAGNWGEGQAAHEPQGNPPAHGDVRRSPNHPLPDCRRIEASPIGRLISLRGLSVESGMMIVAFCRRYQLDDRLSWLYFALTLPDANPIPIFINYEEEAGRCYRGRLCDYVGSTTAIAEELRKMASADYVLSDAQQRRLKGAFLLLDWISDLETVELELKYRTNIGSILQVAETVSWLLDGAAAIASLLNRPAELVDGLRELATAVGNGYDLPGSVLQSAGFCAEQRDLVWRLFNQGITTAAHFTDQYRGKLASIVGEALAEQLIEKFKATNDNNNQSPAEVGAMSQLRLRGMMRNDRVFLNYNETEIDVTPKSFNYLFKLTAARLLNHDGWLSKEEMEPGFNQAKNIYRVKQELKRFATGLEDRIENNKSGFYRINLLPGQIRIDFDSMKAFSDMELAELTKRLEGQAVC